MLDLRLYDWVIILLIPITCLALGLGKRPRPSGWVDYFLARNKLSTTNTVSNYVGANLVFTAIFLVLSLEGTRRGWWVLAVPIAWAFGTGLLIYLYPKMLPYLEKGETLHQALGSIYDNGQTGWGTVRRWASLWTILAFIGGVSLEFYGGVLLLDWVGVPQLYKETLATILAFVCATFTIRGGLRGIGRVNTFLDVMSAVGIISLFYFIQKATWSGVTGNIVQNTPIPHPTFSITDNLVFAFAAFFIFVPMQLCALDTWQRGVAWNRKKRREIAGPLIFGALCICLASYVAIDAGNYIREKGLPIPEGQHPLFSLLSILDIPTPFIGLVVGGFIAAILSTADELLNCCGYAVLADFLNLPRDVENQELSDRYIKSGKFYTGVFAFIAAALAIGGIRLQREISDLANVAFATQVVFILPILFAFYSKYANRLHTAALLAMMLAFATALGMTVTAWNIGKDGQIYIDSASIVAFSIASIVMFVGCLIVYIKERRVKKTRGN